MNRGGIYVRKEELTIRRAVDHLVSAAGALRVATPDNKAAALIHAGLAMMEIARSDPDELSLELAVETIRRVRDS